MDAVVNTRLSSTFSDPPYAARKKTRCNIVASKGCNVRKQLNPVKAPIA